VCLLVHKLISHKKRVGLKHVHHGIFVVFVVGERRMLSAADGRADSERKRCGLAPKSVEEVHLFNDSLYDRIAFPKKPNLCGPKLLSILQGDGHKTSFLEPNVAVARALQVLLQAQALITLSWKVSTDSGLSCDIQLVVGGLIRLNMYSVKVAAWSLQESTPPDRKMLSRKRGDLARNQGTEQSRAANVKIDDVIETREMGLITCRYSSRPSCCLLSGCSDGVSIKTDGSCMAMQALQEDRRLET
jgi:hypothetical protein